MSRRSGGARLQSGRPQPGRNRRRRDHREDDEDLRDYDNYDDYDDYEDEVRPVRRRSRPRRALLGFYKFITVISALIVFGYLGLSLAIRPPEHEAPILPESSAAETVKPDPADPNALIRREKVYTVLLAATDEEGFRTDTMMVATYDVPNQRVGVVSVPRDTITRREKGSNPKLVYGHGGVEQRAKDISNMLGIPIDYYVKVDIRGFIALVDYLDGIDFYVPCDMEYDDPYQGGPNGLHIHFREGMQHLSGQEAMEVARFRKNNNLKGYSDVGRTQTQQELLIALAKKVISWNSIPKITGFAEIFNQYVETNMKLEHMLYFGTQALGLDTGTGVETATLEGRGDAVYRGSKFCYELDRDKTLETVNRLLNPYTRELTLEDMDVRQADSYMN